MTEKEIETRVLRQGAYIAALENLLTAVFEQFPENQRKSIVTRYEKTDKDVSDLLHFEDFSDDELEAFREAHRQLLRLIAKGGSAPD